MRGTEISRIGIQGKERGAMLRLDEKPVGEEYVNNGTD